MKVSVSEIENRQVVLDIEVEPERVQKALNQAFQRASSRVNIPGFRKGKAPRSLVERVVGSDALMEDALEKLVPQVYDEALKEQGITVLGRPRLEVTSTEPLQFKATVALEPKVELGEYLAIRRERPSAEPTQDELDAVVNRLRETHAEWVPVERPVQLRDRVSLDVKAEADARTILDSTNAETIVDPQRPQPAPGFAEALVGIAPAETREFTLTLPDDYSDEAIRGEQVRFSVTVHGVKERKLPELDDDFARQVGEEYESFEALRAKVFEQVSASKQASTERDYEDAVLNDAVAAATVQIPPQLVERQAEHLLHQFARSLERQGISIEQYLRFSGQTAELLREKLLIDAVAALSRSLVIDAVAAAEQVVASDEELELEIERLAADPENASPSAQTTLTQPETRERVRSALRQRAAVRRLQEIAQQDSPPSEALPAVPEEEVPHASA